MLKKQSLIFSAILVLILPLILSGCGSKTDNTNQEGLVTKPAVSAISVNKTNQIETALKLTGTVKPATRISLIALTSGRVVSLPKQVGDSVFKNNLIVQLYDEGTEFNYSTALNNYQNSQSSLSSTQLSADEAISQAELSLTRAEQALTLAESNYEAQVSLTGETMDNTLRNAVVTAQSGMDSLYVALLTFDDLLNKNIPDHIYSVMSPEKKSQSEINYEETKKQYNQIKDLTITTENVEDSINKILDVISQAQTAADLIMQGLNNTPTGGSEFSQATKETYINTLFSRQSTLSSAQTSIQTAKQSIVSTRINNQSTLDSYLNQKNSAEIQLKTAQSSLTNAQQTTTNSVANTQISFDRTRNELNQATIQKNRLSISSPLSGVISQLNVEIGDEVGAGQLIGEIAQIDSMEIEVEVSPEIAAVLQINQSVKISGAGEGSISVINPTADQSSGKVKVKIALPSESQIIAESFLTVEIPIALPTSQEEVYVVPLKSIYLSSDSAKIKIIEDGKVKTLTVKTGKTVGDLIEITEGLNDGQLVITGGADFLSDDTEVEIKTQN